MLSSSDTARGVRPGRNRPPRAAALVLFAAVTLAGGLLPGCGKKGPPLPPLIRVPAAADGISARRLGDTVYIHLIVPARNQDSSTPADITWLEVYGYTGTPAGDDDYVKRGTLVASIPVRKPPDENERRKQESAGKKDGAEKEKPPPAEKTDARREPGFEQGATITVSEKLTPALLQPVVRPAPKTPTVPPGSKQAPVAAAAQTPTRLYVAVGRNHSGRRGAFSRPVGVSIAPVPPAPSALKLTYTESQITVAWNEGEAAAVDQAEAGAQAVAYNVYPVPPGGTLSAAERPSVDTQSAPTPLNDKPISGTSFADPRLEFGTERCYVVRAVATTGTAQVESEPSEAACVTPKDVFPPAAPKGLTAVTTTGAINLLWEPNTEADLDGYLVLRGDAPGGTLQPITRQPIHETTFNDTTIKAGVRYVYAVVAVDKTGNIGAQSNRVEETGR